MVLPDSPNHLSSLNFVSDSLNCQPDLRSALPHTVVSINGTELTWSTIVRCSQERRVEWHYIAPGKPIQNGLVECFNGRLRD